MERGEIPQFALLQEWFPQSHCHAFEPFNHREHPSAETGILEQEGKKLLELIIECPKCTTDQSAGEGVDDALHIKRRIVFFGHDLGGSVIKRALIFAMESPSYRRISETSRAIFFFAGLHNAAKKEGWERHLASLISVSQKDVHKVFGNIQTLPTALSMLSEDFINISGSYLMFNVYEKTGAVRLWEFNMECFFKFISIIALNDDLPYPDCKRSFRN